VSRNFDLITFQISNRLALAVEFGIILIIFWSIRVIPNSTARASRLLI
jgi:hypothetical protein